MRLLYYGLAFVGAAFAVESVGLLVPGVLAAVAACIVRDRIGDAGPSGPPAQVDPEPA